jgi:glutathione S-transferase
VRWALEEAGLPYEERLIGPEDGEAGCQQSARRPDGGLRPVDHAAA